MAHKKGGGSTRNGRDSKAQFRGVKVFVELVPAGSLASYTYGREGKAKRLIDRRFDK